MQQISTIFAASLGLAFAASAQSVSVVPQATVPMVTIDMDNAGPGPGPVTLAAINAAGSPIAGDIQNLTLTPNTAAVGAYNTNPQGLALGLLNGGLELISDANGAFDAFDASIDLARPSTEIGIGIGDWVAAMTVDFYLGGTLVTTATSNPHTVTEPYQILQMTGGTFDRVDIRATTTGGNWVITQIGIENPAAPAPYGLVGVAETTPGTGMLGTSGGSFTDLDWLRWNYDDDNGAYSGMVGAVVANYGSGGSAPIGVSPIPGFRQVWALSTPVGIADVLPPLVVGGPDFSAIVPPGLFSNGDTVRIQAIILDPSVTGPFPVVASRNTVEFRYSNCLAQEGFEGIPTGAGNYPAGWANGAGTQEWRPNTGGTTSAATGPTSAAEGQNYMYCETSAPVTVGDVFSMNSATYTNASATTLNFQLSRIGTEIGQLEVFFNDGTNPPVLLNTYTAADPSQSQGGVEWSTETLTLPQPLPASYSFEFRYTTLPLAGGGATFNGDIAIDDVCVN